MASTRWHRSDEQAKAKVICVALDLFCAGYTASAVGRALGIHHGTVLRWVRRWRPWALEEPNRVTIGKAGRCDVCGILLGMDALEAPDGEILHPASQPGDGRCWECREQYGTGPAVQILAHWAADNLGQEEEKDG